jgi:hypothetical protein
MRRASLLLQRQRRNANHVPPKRRHARFAEVQLGHAVPDDEIELSGDGGEIGRRRAEEAGEGGAVAAEGSAVEVVVLGMRQRFQLRFRPGEEAEGLASLLVIASAAKQSSDTVSGDPALD